MRATVQQPFTSALTGSGPGCRGSAACAGCHAACPSLLQRGRMRRGRQSRGLFRCCSGASGGVGGEAGCARRRVFVLGSESSSSSSSSVAGDALRPGAGRALAAACNQACAAALHNHTSQTRTSGAHAAWSSVVMASTGTRAPEAASRSSLSCRARHRLQFCALKKRMVGGVGRRLRVRASCVRSSPPGMRTVKRVGVCCAWPSRIQALVNDGVVAGVLCGGGAL